MPRPESRADVPDRWPDRLAQGCAAVDRYYYHNELATGDRVSGVIVRLAVMDVGGIGRRPGDVRASMVVIGLPALTFHTVAQEGRARRRDWEKESWTEKPAMPTSVGADDADEERGLRFTAGEHADQLLLRRHRPGDGLYGYRLYLVSMTRATVKKVSGWH